MISHTHEKNLVFFSPYQCNRGEWGKALFPLPRYECEWFDSSKGSPGYPALSGGGVPGGVGSVSGHLNQKALWGISAGPTTQRLT
jgi:hypothetical protein